MHEFAFIEERRCQIMIGLWQYFISEMGFEMPRDVEVNGFHLRFCRRTNLVLYDEAKRLLIQLSKRVSIFNFWARLSSDIATAAFWYRRGSRAA